MRWLSHLESVVALGVGVGATAIAIGEHLNLIHVSDESMKHITIGAFGIVAICLTVVLHKQLQLQEDVKHALNENAIDRVREMVKGVDPMLQTILGDSIQERLDNLDRLLSHHDATIRSPEAFLHFWVKTFHAYPGKKYMATSLARNSYFWKSDRAIDAMRFILKKKTLGVKDTGDKMRRIFLLDSAEELATEEARAIMDRQVALGVTVRTLIVDDLTTRRLFLCTDDCSIAWEVLTKASGEFKEAVVTTDTPRVTAYRAKFEAWWLAADDYRPSQPPANVTS